MVKGAISKRKGRIILGQHIFCGVIGLQGFYHADYLFFLWRMEGAHVTDYLPGAGPGDSRLVG